MTEILKRALWAVTAALTVFSLWQLERERLTVSTQELASSAGPITIYMDEAATNGPLVLMSHGFAGSRQMMQYIARDLARAGFVVASFDYIGHGRHTGLLSPDVTRIEGTTQQLVDQTQGAFAAVRAHLGPLDQIAVLGHSMATDIIIRAVKDVPQVSDVVAISMYSEAVTPDFPRRLLVISGEWEGRLRDVGREVVAQVSGREIEGETVQAGDVLRRAIYAPGTEHVAVLFDRVTLDETRAWLAQGFQMSPDVRTRPMGPYILLVLVGIVVLTAPMLRLLPVTANTAEPVSRNVYLAAVLLPVIPAGLAAVLLSGGFFGIAAFGGLFWFFSVWGCVGCAVLWRAGHRFSWPSARGMALFFLWSLVVFAVALDRYGAAFLPLDMRLWLMLALLPGTLLFMLADRALAASAPLWRRVLSRTLPVVVLSGTMLIYPENMGLLFTVLPVMVLFFMVYGAMGTLVARRCGAETAAVSQAVILAWSLAASTPLFAV